ncbi:MAG TPA: MFS transporter, partial [Longimicrobiaceae bacterium]|nr:MFS transporter [Longimicrobiaceae bacterium]
VPPRLAALAGLVAAWMLASALVLPFFNLYFRREHDLPIGRIGVLFAGVQAVTALAIFVSGEAAARVGPRRTLAFWTLVFTPALWALAGAQGVGIAVALYFVQGIVPPATNPLIDQLLLERAPPGREGTVSSWRNAATDGAGLVGASLGGVVLERGSFQLLFGIAGGVALAAAVLLLGALRATAPARGG